MGDRNVECDENTRLLHIDAKNIYGWAMSQPLPSGDFEDIGISLYTTQEIIEDSIMVLGDNESGFFIQCDLQNPVENKEKQKILLCSFKQKKIQSCLHPK